MSWAEFQDNFENEPDGFTRMLGAIRERVSNPLFVCESAGYYGAALIAFLREQRCRICPVSPFRARRFAEATGTFVKTDRERYFAV